MLHIGMITSISYEKDLRIRKELSALLKIGHQVSLCCLKKARKEPHCTAIEGNFHIWRAAPSRTEGLGAVVSRSVNVASEWKASLEAFIQTRQPDVLHVGGLYLLPVAFFLAKRHGLPVVADLYEDYPKATRTAVFQLDGRRKGFLHRLRIKLQAEKVRLIERWTLPRCAGVIIVVEEASERLLRYKTNPNRIVVVSNTEDETTIGIPLERPSQASEPAGGVKEGSWRAIYFGGMGGFHRGIDTAIAAAGLARDSIPGFSLQLVGCRKKQMEVYPRLISQASAHDVVELMPWLPQKEGLRMVRSSDAALIPYHDIGHTNSTVPHKLFQYMLLGRPVVVSNVRPLQRIVESCECGLVFEAGDPGDLARCLGYLYKHPQVARQLGENGRRAALGPYSWSNDSKRLCDLYHDIEEKQLEGQLPRPVWAEGRTEV
ncbi:MAG: glycosyltransferase family 4 protein [bacterium]